MENVPNGNIFSHRHPTPPSVGQFLPRAYAVYLGPGVQAHGHAACIRSKRQALPLTGEQRPCSCSGSEHEGWADQQSVLPCRPSRCTLRSRGEHMQKEFIGVALAGVVAGAILTVVALILFQAPSAALEWAKSNPIPIATVFSAILGFAGVAWATGIGFRNLIASQEAQSRRDRESREHQAILDRRKKAEDLTDERQALASALSGELTAAYNQMKNSIPILELQISVFNQFGERNFPDSPLNIAKFLPNLPKYIFQANIQKLGILGPSTLSDVVDIYQLLVWDRDIPPATSLDYAQIAKILEGYVKIMRDWQRDAHHVQLRLLSIFGTVADPGPLADARAKRASEGIFRGAAQPE